MACATLKRPHEFDSMYGSPSKRARRAGPTRVVGDRAAPFAEQLARKLSPSKANRAHHRPGHQLKFDEAVSRVRERNGNGEAPDGQQPLFTYGQLKLICERRLSEQAQRIREDYERTLQEKRAEQYDTFIKFTHDQILRGSYKPDAPPSYLS